MWLQVRYWIDHVWSSIECVCCVCGPSEHLDAPSICFVCVFVCLGVLELVHRCLYGGLSESELCAFREFCPVCFLVVGECPSVLL